MKMNDIALRAEAIAESEDLSPITRALARTIVQNGYVTLGNWLRNLSDADIEYLSDVVEVTEDDDKDLFESATEEIVLLTLMLVNGEGINPESLEELSHNTGYLKMAVAGTSLARHGLVEVFYENMSFGEETGDKVVFKRIM
jgi:hypothetical protein